MSNQNLSKQIEISKPKGTIQSTVIRTVSANYELETEKIDNVKLESKEKITEKVNENLKGDSLKKLKLNVNSNTYIPKNKPIKSPEDSTNINPPLKNKNQIQPNLNNLAMNQFIWMNNPPFYYRKIYDNFSEYDASLYDDALPSFKSRNF